MFEKLTGLAFFGSGSFGSGLFLKRRPSDASISPYAARAATKYQTQSIDRLAKALLSKTAYCTETERDYIFPSTKFEDELQLHYNVDEDALNWLKTTATTVEI